MILNKRRVLFIISGVITIVVLAGILALWLNLKIFTPQIEAAASTALGTDVRIKGRMGIAFFPGPRSIAEGRQRSEQWTGCGHN